MAELPLEANFEMEEHSKENLDIDNSVEIQTLLTGDELIMIHDRLQAREEENVKLKEETQRLEKENKNLKELNSKLQHEVLTLNYALENNRFDIDKYKDKR